MVGGRADASSIVFTGMGVSYCACHVPVTVLAGRGRDATMVEASELLHFRRPMLDEDTVMVVVSQSGESAEVVRLIEELREGPRPFVVSITNGTTSALAAAADAPLDIRAGPETGPSTKTFAATLVVLAALAEVLAGRPADQAAAQIAAEAERAASGTASILEGRDELAERVASWCRDRSAVALLGRGTARAASETAALVLKEAARLPVEALQSAQFRHGPIELAGPGLAVGMIATEPATAPLDLGLAEELERAGTSVLVVEAGDNAPARPRRVGVPPVARALLPALAVVPFQLLAWRLSIERGLVPGELAIAQKVTTRE
jgi:glucosamine--fructose-6-phosphate aminotransferase (isomerizing)